MATKLQISNLNRQIFLALFALVAGWLVLTYPDAVYAASADWANPIKGKIDEGTAGTKTVVFAGALLVFIVTTVGVGAFKGIKAGLLAGASVIALIVIIASGSTFIDWAKDIAG